jgi:hypothetical protein
MKTYEAFYREFGVRSKAHVTSPKSALLSKLELPKESVLHHIPNDDLDIGPSMSDPVVAEYGGRMVIKHHFDLIDPKPIPRNNTSMSPSNMEKEYKRRFKKIRLSPDIDRSLRDEKTLAIHNYAGFTQTTLYPVSTFTNYHKWNNAISSSIKTIPSTMKNNIRQHYVIVNVPESIPTIKMLHKSQGSYTDIHLKLIKIFSKPEYLLLSKIWAVFGEGSQASLFKDYTTHQLERLNLIFVDGSNWSVLNLGKFLELVNRDYDKEDTNSPESIPEGSRIIQVKFYDYLMNLVNLRTGGIKVIHEDDDDKSEVKEPNEITTKEMEVIYDSGEGTEDEFENELENWNNAAGDKNDVEIEVPTFKAVPSLNLLKDTIDKKAEDGKISAAEYKRYERLIDTSKNIPNPYGSGTIDDFRKISTEDLSIEDIERQLPKTAGVIDASLTQSTIQLMDAKYIDKVLTKDIANAAMAIQSAGVVVTEYNVERVKNAMNDFSIVRMKLNPVDGASSTVSFRIPTVQPDGTFLANNVKMRYRKQRVDIPIRKVSTNSVALTSYYAKVFVDRSEMKVVNYGKWISSQLRLMFNNDEDDRVSKLIYGDNFFHDVELPRIYTILAQSFGLIKTKDGINLFFNYEDRLEKLDSKILKVIEKDDMVFCGFIKSKPIVVDKLNVFYVVDGKSLEVLGTIEDILKITTTNIPTDIAEFRLFSKNVPVGIVLGYKFGLTNLMNVLGVTPRRVTVGTKVELTAAEYAIKFNDETLIFQRSDQKAQLILAGLNRYHKDIKRYSVDDFDNPDVFVNVMDDNGIKIGFVRELSLAFNMFVDPITLDILKEIKEPETLDGLIIRSCEMLLSDSHPKETSMEHMRIRGYERFAGAAYSELVRSVRKFKSRGVAGAAKIEMNPEAVWQAIAMDTSKSQVEELNPIENIRETELMTYMGTGGRSAQSMVKRTRVFLDSDVGIVSEGSTDSGTVGVNNLLSPNANFKNLRGVGDIKALKDIENSSLLSTAALLSPAANKDDPKRVL